MYSLHLRLPQSEEHTCEPSSSERARPVFSPRSHWPGAGTTCSWSTAMRDRRDGRRCGVAAQGSHAVPPRPHLPQAGRRRAAGRNARRPRRSDRSRSDGRDIGPRQARRRFCAGEWSSSGCSAVRRRRSTASRSSRVTSTRCCRNTAAPPASPSTAAPWHATSSSTRPAGPAGSPVASVHPPKAVTAEPCTSRVSIGCAPAQRPGR